MHCRQEDGQAVDEALPHFDIRTCRAPRGDVVRSGKVCFTESAIILQLRWIPWTGRVPRDMSLRAS